MSSTSAEPPARRRDSLATRLTLWYAGSAFLLILGATGFLYRALMNNLDREDDELLSRRTQALRTLLRERPGDEAALRRAVGQDNALHDSQLFIRLLDGERTVLETPGMAGELPPEDFPPPT